MSNALRKLNCNGKYNSHTYSYLKMNYKHSEETKKNISKSRVKNSKEVYIYDLNGELVEKTKMVFARKKYPASLLVTSIDKFFGFSTASRGKLRKKNSKYIGWFVSEEPEFNKEKIKMNLEKINNDFKKVYIFSYNKIIDEIPLMNLNKLYPTLKEEKPKGDSKESRRSLKVKGNLDTIGMYYSFNKDFLYCFENFGDVYIENKPKFKIYNEEILIGVFNKVEIFEKFPEIKHALSITSKDRPLGKGHYKQNAWLKKNKLERFEGYYMESLKNETKDGVKSETKDGVKSETKDGVKSGI